MTLKVIKLPYGDMLPDTEHENGGYNFEQLYAFRHLFPKGYATIMEEDMLYFLAREHGWTVELKQKDYSDPPPEATPGPAIPETEYVYWNPGETKPATTPEGCQWWDATMKRWEPEDQEPNRWEAFKDFKRRWPKQ